MVDFDVMNFTECRSEEVMSLFFLTFSVCRYIVIVIVNLDLFYLAAKKASCL